MSVSVVTAWHNEAMIAPFFLNHYAYADKIVVIMGDDTTDESRELCLKRGNVEIEDFTFPDMLLNDIIKAEKMSSVAGEQKTDWVYVVDADEFVFPAGGESPDAVLGRQAGNVMYARMWNVYRHKTDPDLDPEKPPVFQRRHGDPSFKTPGAYKTGYIKPIIVRPQFKFRWYPGNHMLIYNEHTDECSESFLGVHWAMADEEMAVKRRIGGMKGRLSADNIKYGMGEQYIDITEETIRSECAEHANDQMLF